MPTRLGQSPFSRNVEGGGEAGKRTLSPSPRRDAAASASSQQAGPAPFDMFAPIASQQAPAALSQAAQDLTFEARSNKANQFAGANREATAAAGLPGFVQSPFLGVGNIQTGTPAGLAVQELTSIRQEFPHISDSDFMLALGLDPTQPGGFAVLPFIEDQLAGEMQFFTDPVDAVRAFGARMRANVAQIAGPGPTGGAPASAPGTVSGSLDDFFAFINGLGSLFSPVTDQTSTISEGVGGGLALNPAFLQGGSIGL